MAKVIEGDIETTNKRKPSPYKDEWFDGQQWEITWGWGEPEGEFDIPATIVSPLTGLRAKAKRLGKKIHIVKVTSNPWVYRIQTFIN